MNRSLPLGSEFRPLNGVEALSASVRSTFRSCARRALKPTTRSRAVVDGEYNEGHWSRMLESAAWTRAQSLDAFLIGNDHRSIVCRVEDRLCRARSSDYYAYRLIALPALLSEALGTTTPIVEIGCGFGYNLLTLAHAFPAAQLRGYDIAENGLEAGRRIASHFGISERVGFGHIDLTNRTSVNFSALRDAAVFSFFCLEQIPAQVELVVANILEQRPRRVVHIEPGTWGLNPLNPMHWPNLAYIPSVHYQTRLYEVLFALRDAGRIRLLRCERMSFAPTIQNDGVLVVWEPT